MASNFDFLKLSHPKVFHAAADAEALVFRSPRASCFQARFSLETVVLWLYRTDPGLRLPYASNLGALIHEQSFRDNLPQAVFSKVLTIQKQGNRAAHSDKPVTARDSVHLVKELFFVLNWVAKMYAPDGVEIPKRLFNPQLLPTKETVADQSRAQVAALEAQLQASTELQAIKEARLQTTEAELEAAKEELRALRERNAPHTEADDYNEEETRTYFIDLMLKEAGWDLANPGRDTEYEVSGMPTEGSDLRQGKGFVDYVLWDDDGKPLALVEAKRTRHNPSKGRHQAKLYADCLEAEFGVRPVVFCSNGYEHEVWDDLRYPPRLVSGFYTKAELQRLIQRRQTQKPLVSIIPNPEIAGRSYQTEAIKRVSEAFDDKARTALIVMATGTGKTRTTIALVDVLKRAEWVKRVLFLADRKGLVTQAKRAFTSHLPSVTAVDITQDRDQHNATVVLSTYPTMMNRIDQRHEGAYIYGPGYFDLIVVDEAHRSTYQKYGAIFEYFDGLKLALTATPRSEENRHTYEVFGLEDGVPTYYYETNQAVKDGYLVPPKGISAPFRFLHEGITYDELKPEDKVHYEEALMDPETGEIPEHIVPSAMNAWLFNDNTIDQAIALLMERGLKSAGGDELGKTIIFARNQKHAELIEKRFNLHYPTYAGHFAQVIVSKNDYAQSLIDSFSDPKSEPTIAISVDMLDTGIDVPECVNLLLFKPVRSKTKFIQMLGRGTRLCENLYGLGNHKTHFLVFDLCSNFEFFKEELDRDAGKLPESLTARLVRSRVELYETLAGVEAGLGAELKSELLDHLHEHVATMTVDNFLVRKHRRAVEMFSDRARWDSLSAEDLDVVANTLSKLPNGLPKEGPEPKQFDVLAYRLMSAVAPKVEAVLGAERQSTRLSAAFRRGGDHSHGESRVSAYSRDSA